MNFELDRDFMPKKPVITSLTSANHQLETWIRENECHKCEDKDGVIWNIEIEDIRRPDSLSTSTIYGIKIVATSFVTSQILIETGTFDAQKDSRLIGLIGESRIPFTIKPLMLQAKTIEDARNLFSEKMLEFRKSLSSGSWHGVKRELIAKWIEKRKVFSTPLDG